MIYFIVVSYVLFVSSISIIVHKSMYKKFSTESVLVSIFMAWLFSLLGFLILSITGAIIFTINMVMGG